MVSPDALVSIVATGSLATLIVTDAVYVQPPPGVVTSKVTSAPLGITPAAALYVEFVSPPIGAPFNNHLKVSPATKFCPVKVMASEAHILLSASLVAILRLRS